MVTAEIAAAVPALLLLLGTGVGLATVVVDDIRCVDAARAGARAAARGDDGAASARAVAPSGSGISIIRGEGVVTVTVDGPDRPTTAWLPASLHPRAQVRAALEEAAP